jgi:coproporphyrinogen III oxidase
VAVQGEVSVLLREVCVSSVANPGTEGGSEMRKPGPVIVKTREEVLEHAKRRRERYAAMKANEPEKWMAYKKKCLEYYYLPRRYRASEESA